MEGQLAVCRRTPIAFHCVHRSLGQTRGFEGFVRCATHLHATLDVAHAHKPLLAEREKALQEGKEQVYNWQDVREDLLDRLK